MIVMPQFEPILSLRVIFNLLTPKSRYVDVNENALNPIYSGKCHISQDLVKEYMTIRKPAGISLTWDRPEDAGTCAVEEKLIKPPFK